MENAVEIVNLGKMYRLFDKQSDRIQDIFGLDKLRFWDREPRYREFWALRNINLTVPKGERIGIIGRNGAGKSTLVGEVVRRLDPSVRALAIPQEPTAEQCRGALSRLATLDSRSRGRVLAVAAALNSDPDRLVEGDRTSPGEMRKLMLGLGMLDAPELIIMDEPSNYLDLHSVEALERLLAAFPGALLLVSHDAALLEATTSVCWEISESSPETSILTVGWR